MSGELTWSLFRYVSWVFRSLLLFFPLDRSLYAMKSPRKSPYSYTRKGEICKMKKRKLLRCDQFLVTNCCPIKVSSVFSRISSAFRFRWKENELYTEHTKPAAIKNDAAKTMYAKSAFSSHSKKNSPVQKKTNRTREKRKTKNEVTEKLVQLRLKLPNNRSEMKCSHPFMFSCCWPLAHICNLCNEMKSRCNLVTFYKGRTHLWSALAQTHTEDIVDCRLLRF